MSHAVIHVRKGNVRQGNENTSLEPGASACEEVIRCRKRLDEKDFAVDNELSRE